MQQYINGFNSKDSKLLTSLFSDTATIEDPVGGENIVKGKEAITMFYGRAVEMVDRLELAAPIRGSYGNYAAMAFNIFMTSGGKNIQIGVIDVMTFDDTGKITEMKAYHGPGDMIEG